MTWEKEERPLGNRIPVVLVGEIRYYFTKCETKFHCQRLSGDAYRELPSAGCVIVKYILL